MREQRDQTPIVFDNARMLTMDRDRPGAGALIVQGGRIVAIGDPEYVGGDLSAARRIDLGGRVVMPGFIDAHCHLEMSALDLGDAIPCFTPPLRSLADICDAVAARGRQRPAGSWLVGRGNFAMYRWVSEQRSLTRHDLDRAAPDHPAIVFAGLHSCTLNTRALELTGLEHDPPPRGATIDPATGRGTELWDKLDLPQASVAHTADAIVAWGRRLFVERGVTAIGEIVYSRHGVHAYQALRRERRLPLRVRLWWHVPRLGSVAELSAAGLESGFGDEWLSVGGIKLFVDGAGYDAWGNTEPAADRQWSQTDLDEQVRLAHDAGLQLLMHVAPSHTGAQMALRALRSALAHNPRADHRHRIEHLGDMVPDWPLLDELRGLGIEILSTPQFLHNSPEDSVCPLRSLRERGFAMPGNSDCTGTQPEAADPMFGIWCAVARLSKDGTEVMPEEALTVEEALRMYTADAAWADHMADQGVLRVGALADLAVLDADPREVDPDRLRELSVAMTVIGGEPVYGAGELEEVCL